MKKKMILMVCLAVMGILSVKGQKSIAILHHEGNVTIFPGGELQKAIDASEKGDTIYLSDGVFSGGSLSHGLVILGGGQNTKVGGLTITSNDSTEVKGGFVLSGMHILEDFTIDSNHEAGFLYRLNDDNFKYCLKNSHLLVFKNGLLLPPTYYYLHSIVNTPINDVGIIFNVELTAGDIIDVFYVTNDLHHLECDYYDMKNKERYIKNGSILLNTHSNEYRVMGEQMPNENVNWRTNYIKMRSPLYAISSKHSTFVFLNGKKVRFDELEDISDTIMSINTDYARNNEDMNAVRLEVINHLDTQDIIEQLFINDGLNHDDLVAQNQFNSTNKPNAYKDTLRIKHWSITDLESYAERTLLDEMLNDLSDENLNKLFYNWNNKTGPMTPYDEEAMNEPDFINPDEIIPTIIDEYYFEEDGDKFIWHTIPTTDNVDGESNTVFYIGEGESVRVPVRWNGEETRALYGTTFNRNKTIKKVVIPEGVTSIE